MSNPEITHATREGYDAWARWHTHPHIPWDQLSAAEKNKWLGIISAAVNGWQVAAARSGMTARQETTRTMIRKLVRNGTRYDGHDEAYVRTERWSVRTLTSGFRRLL